MQAVAQLRKARPDTYSKVFDSRKRRVRGMWQRNDRYFANITITDDLDRKSSKMVPLSGVTLDEAREDYRRLLSERDDDRLRPMGQVPTFREFSMEYRKERDASGKRVSTLAKEKGYLKRWDEKIGHIRLNKIRPFHLSRVLTDFRNRPTRVGRLIFTSSQSAAP